MGFLDRFSKKEKEARPSDSDETHPAAWKPEHADADLAKYESQGNGEVRNAFEEGGKSYRTLGLWQTALVMVTNQIGLGILSLPNAALKIGLVPAVILIIALGLLTAYTAYVLLQYYRRYPHVLNMSDQAKVLGGRVLEVIFTISMLIKLILTCASASVTMSIALNSMSNHGMCTVAFIAFPVIGCWLISLPRTFKWVAHCGIPSTISIVAAVFIVIITLGVAKPQGFIPDEGVEIHAFRSPDFATGVSAFTQIVYSYAGNVGFPSLMAEMKDPSKDFVPALVILQVFSIAFYLISAISIYCLAGQYTSSPALGSAAVLPAKIAYGIAFPALLATGLVFGHTAIKLLFVVVMRALKSEKQMTDRSFKSRAIWVACATIFWICAFVLANAIPIFNSIVSISSATFVAWFTFGISGVFWLHLNKGQYFSSPTKITLFIVNWLIVILALFLNSAGLYSAITGIIDIFNDPDSGLSGVFPCADNGIF